MSIGDKIKQVWNKGQEDINTRADRGVKYTLNLTHCN